MLYVDDILLIIADTTALESTKKRLKSKLDVKDMGQLSEFLDVKLSWSNCTLYLSQEGYVENVLGRFGMAKCKSVATPMCRLPFSSTVADCLVDKTKYQELIGSLLFFSTRMRPEICVAINLLCRHASDPKSCHLVSAKRCLRYLQATRNYGLTLKPRDGSLVGFSNSDWGSGCVDRRSTRGLLLQLNGSSVLWKSKKKLFVALSTSEAEFVSASEMCKDILWIRHFLEGLGIEQFEVTKLMEDNQGVLFWPNEGICRAKHVAIRGTFVRDQVLSGTVKLTYCETSRMSADNLTMPLDCVLFENNPHLGIRELPADENRKGN